MAKLYAQLLSGTPSPLLTNPYTTGLAPSVLSYVIVVEACLKYHGTVEAEEVSLPVTGTGLVLPCGVSGRWSSM